MHETIREFAQERLIERDDATATAARHCDYYLNMAKTGRAKLLGPEQAEWTRRLESELDNLRAAIALALSGGADPVLAVKFEVALMNFRILRGYGTEARKNMRAVLALPGVLEPNIARGHALYVGGVLATSQGDYAEATQLLTECLALRRNLAEPSDIAATLSTLSVLYLRSGNAPKAFECEQESIGIFRQLGDKVGEAIGLLHLGEIGVQVADDGQAQVHFEQCLALARSIKHQELESECERNLGELALAKGDLEIARARFERSLAVCRDGENKRDEAIALWCLGKTSLAKGDHGEAAKRFAESLRAFESFEMNVEALDCLEDCAVFLQTVGRPEHAVRLQAATTSIRAALALPRSPRDEPKRERNISAAREAAGEAAFNAAWAEGERWAFDDAIEYVLESIATVPGVSKATVTA
jgi:tetratricopeptide (TPR) repeat protein